MCRLEHHEARGEGAAACTRSLLALQGSQLPAPPWVRGSLSMHPWLRAPQHLPSRGLALLQGNVT